jgi:hypothetical protein
MNNNVNINLATLPNIKCECGCFYWKQTLLTKKVPALMVGAPHDQIVNVPVLLCYDCDRLLPDHEILIKESAQIKEKQFKN